MREPMRHDTLANLGWLKPEHERNHVPQTMGEGNMNSHHLVIHKAESKGYVHSEHKLMDNWKATERYDNVVPTPYRVKSFSQQPKTGLFAKPNDFGAGIGEGKYEVDDFLNG